MHPATATHPAATDSSLVPRADLRFLRAHVAHFVALGAGSGLPRLAPGTWGTLFGWALFVLLDRWLGDAQWLLLIGATVALGAWAAQRTGAALRQADSGHIVIDEIAAFWLVLVLLPDDTVRPWLWQAAGFVLFRFFDIAKPAPIRYFDARFKNGFGVMLDDLVAAFFTLVVLALWTRIF